MIVSPRDIDLIDRLEERPVLSFSGTVWRVVKKGRNPCSCSRSGGRWDDGTFDVLYTSLDRDGAIAEMYFHLKRGQPVFPSKLQYTLHELHVEFDGVVNFPNTDSLSELGVDIEQYGRLAYVERESEYPRTQEVSEALHFLGGPDNGEVSGILAPNARWQCQNLIVFCELAGPDAVEEICDHGVVDWKSWERKNITK